MHNAGRKLPPEPLQADEVRRIYEHLDRSWRPETLRARAFITICLRGLLRASEALSLYPKDLDLELGQVRVLHGKGRRSRAVGLDKKACLLVADWLQARRQLGVDIDQPVFCVIQGPRRGRPVAKSWPRALMKRLQQQCQISRRLHPHGLRHTGACQMLAEGIPMDVISRALGHSNLATTHTYLNHLQPVAVLAAMTRREW